jgi:hypothetical protein
MVGEEWPDRIPAAIADEHGWQRLRDTVTPEVPAHIRADARALAEESVAVVKREVFPIHKLGG